MDKNNITALHKLIDERNAPWFQHDSIDASPGTHITLEWDISDMPGIDLPNASPESFNARTVRAVQKTGIRKCFSPNPIIITSQDDTAIAMLREKRIIDDRTELDPDHVMLVLESYSNVIVERLKGNRMRFSYWPFGGSLPTFEKHVISMEIDYDFNKYAEFLYLNCSSAGQGKKSLQPKYTTESNDKVNQWIENSYSAEALLFLPASALLEHTRQMAQATAMMGWKLEPFFKDVNGSDEKKDFKDSYDTCSLGDKFNMFYKLSLKDEKSIPASQLNSSLTVLMEKLQKRERNLKKKILKESALAFYRTVDTIDRLLMHSSKLTRPYATSLIQFEMAAADFNMLPKNFFFFFSEIFCYMGDTCLKVKFPEYKDEDTELVRCWFIQTCFKIATDDYTAKTGKKLLRPREGTEKSLAELIKNMDKLPTKEEYEKLLCYEDDDDLDEFGPVDDYYDDYDYEDEDDEDE